MNLLFLCTGNSCRSQIAEGWTRKLARELAPGLDIAVQSAGLEAHGLNPRAVAAMARHGIDISSQTSDVLNDEMIDKADLLISVCAHADEHCPLLPPGKEKIHMPFDDPAKATGSDQEVDAVFSTVCQQIKNEVSALLVSLASKVS